MFLAVAVLMGCCNVAFQWFFCLSFLFAADSFLKFFFLFLNHSNISVDYFLLFLSAHSPLYFLTLFFLSDLLNDFLLLLCFFLFKLGYFFLFFQLILLFYFMFYPLLLLFEQINLSFFFLFDLLLELFDAFELFRG